MKGEIYSQADLEKSKHWRATFRIVIARGSPRDIIVCLIKAHPTGYLWKRPNTAYVETVDLVAMQEAISGGRLQLIKGKLPRGIKALAPAPTKKRTEGRRLAV